MPIISATPIKTNVYRITFSKGHNMMENIVVDSNGLYDVYYVSDCQSINKTGRILNVVQNPTIPKNSYILFDSSEDHSNRRERILFYQIQQIVDITPNDAYTIACKHGFVGTVSDWLEYLHGDPGKSAYELAIEAGFTGSEEDYLESLKGAAGYSAYEIAVHHGYNKSEEEWLESLKGESAYQIAVRNGFEGTEEEWLRSLNGKSAYEYAVEHGFEGTEDEYYEMYDITSLKKQVEKNTDANMWKDHM